MFAKKRKMRTNFPSGAPWEDVVGYSRAVRMGKFLEVSGTVAANGHGAVGKGDAHAQTHFILEKIKGVLEQAGFKLSDVIRTRIYTTDISNWQEIGRAHGAFFADIKPATSMLEVKALIHPDYLVEIEVSAMKE